MCRGCTLTLAAAMPSLVRAPRGPPVLQAALVPPDSCTFCCMFKAPVVLLLPKKSVSSATALRGCHCLAMDSSKLSMLEMYVSLG